MTDYKVLVLNPGSTSMKIGLYQNEEKLFAKNFEIPADVIAGFKDAREQFEYRKAMIEKEVADQGYKMEDIDLYLARVGGIVPCASGVYEVNELLEDMNSLDKSTTTPQATGCHFVKAFAAEYGGQGYVINDSAVDEMIDVARVTGLKGTWRQAYSHSLNQRAAAELAAEKYGRKLDDINMVVAHLGGGISIGAFRKGKQIDTSNLTGEGPLTPTRTGALPLSEVMMKIMRQEISAKDMMKLSVAYGGGLLNQLGTADGKEVEARIADGDEYAKLIYDGMIYQIAQTVAKMAASLEGQVDCIVLTGGISYSKYVQEGVKKYCSWIGPIEVFAGEYETESMVKAALRILRGEEEVHKYTGIPTFDPKKFA